MATLVRGLGTHPGVVVLLGATDTGKSTLAAVIAEHLRSGGAAVQVVDTDIGQSDLGAPGTIGWTRVDRPVERLTDLEPAGGFFVGATSPPGVEAYFLAGCCRVVGRARASGGWVVVDTTGLVHGSYGRQLKGAKLEALCPQHIVAVQRSREVEHLLVGWERRAKVWRLEVGAAVQVRNREARVAARRRAYLRAWEGGDVRRFNLEAISCLRTRYRSGSRVDPVERARLSEAVGADVVHAETGPDGPFIVTRGDAPYRAEQVYRRTAVVATTSDYSDLLVGLVDARGELLGSGVLEELDFEQATARVYCRVREAVAALAFGLVRVNRAGEELGRLRPGEL